MCATDSSGGEWLDIKAGDPDASQDTGWQQLGKRDAANTCFTKRVSVALPASQPTLASQAVASTETVYSCNALQCIAKFVSKVYFENSGNFRDRKTGAELSAVSDRSVKEGVAWSLEIGAGI